MRLPIKEFPNPFRPGAGHMPPYLAGRKHEAEEFRKLLLQETIMDNMILTGLRGVGKTVLLATFKPLAIQSEWLWVGTDLSESTSVSEPTFATRLITNLSVATSQIVIGTKQKQEMGIGRELIRENETLNFSVLEKVFIETPGLVSDKLKAVLELAWFFLEKTKWRGIIFAYDEAQNLSDHTDNNEYPLSLLLDTFQSIQRKDIPFMLVLTGLPTLFPKLVGARTYAERMFHIAMIGRLNEEDSREAIQRPIDDIEECPISFTENSVEIIVGDSGGYPYFIQFICREVFDVWIQQQKAEAKASVPIKEIIRKLDTYFFVGGWSRTTDRQRELLSVISNLENCDEEFTVQEIVNLSNKKLAKPFSPSQVNQMLNSLIGSGLIYKNRYGKYSFAVPLMGQFIRRQEKQAA